MPSIEETARSGLSANSLVDVAILSGCYTELFAAEAEWQRRRRIYSEGGARGRGVAVITLVLQTAVLGRLWSAGVDTQQELDTAWKHAH